MTNRERQILQLIERNPMIRQKEIAEKLDITRSSVAVHIRNLTLKGYIKGKGYVLDDNVFVTIIGASNFDIQGFGSSPIIPNNTTRFGNLKESAGGIGRNIAENLTKLGVKTELISITGGDGRSTFILNHCHCAEISTENFLIIKEGRASTYMGILDERANRLQAFADTSILKLLTPKFLNSKSQLLRNSKIIYFDTGFTDELADFVFDNFSDKPIYMSPLSISMHQTRKHLSKIHTLCINFEDVCYLTDKKLCSPTEIFDACREFIEKGLRRIFIIRDKEGVYYYNSADDEFGYVQSGESILNCVSGVSDAFMAGIIFGTMRDMDTKKQIELAITMSHTTAQSKGSVNPLLAHDYIIDQTKILFQKEKGQ